MKETVSVFQMNYKSVSGNILVRSILCWRVLVHVISLQACTATGQGINWYFSQGSPHVRSSHPPKSEIMTELPYSSYPKSCHHSVVCFCLLIHHQGTQPCHASDNGSSWISIFLKSRSTFSDPCLHMYPNQFLSLCVIWKYTPVYGITHLSRWEEAETEELWVSVQEILLFDKDVGTESDLAPELY